jgi:F0F1-type ATP synthase epsilon subunit
MKRHTLAILVSVTGLMVAFVSCDADLRSQVAGWMDSVSDNVYLENGLIDVNTESVDAVVDAIAAIDDVSEAMDEEEQEQLEATLSSTFDSPTQTEILLEELGTDAEEAQQASAETAIVKFEDMLSDLAEDEDMDEDDPLYDALSSFELDVPDTLTNGDILMVQLITNLVGNLETLARSEEDPTEEELLSVADDALFVAYVAEQLSGASAIDFSGQLLSLVDELTALDSRGLSDSETEIATEAVNAIVPDLVTLIGGSYADGTYSYTNDQYEAFAFNQAIYRSNLEKGLALLEEGDGESSSIGISTIGKYAFSVLVTEFDKFIDSTAGYEDPEALVAAYLTQHSGLIDGTLDSIEDLEDFDLPSGWTRLAEDLQAYLAGNKDYIGTLVETVVDNLILINERSTHGIASLDEQLDELYDSLPSLIESLASESDSE